MKENPDMTDAVRKLDDNRMIYAELNRYLEGNRAANESSLFFNWGYADLPGLPNWLPDERVLPVGVNHSHRRLVMELVGGIPLQGKSVMDVGCGRGGALKLLAEEYRPGRLTGMDISPDNIAFCRGSLGLRRSRFQVADACNPPSADASQDVIFNLESSGAYPDFPAFLGHVSRIVKPGGHFLFGDILPSALVPDILVALERLGFEILRGRSVTRHVLEARRNAGSVEGRLFEQGGEGRLASFLEQYRADEGSAIHKAMESGRLSYHLIQARRTARPGEGPSDRCLSALRSRDREFHELIAQPEEGTGTGGKTACFPFGSPRPQCKLTVFAFAHAGGGASVFRDWVAEFNSDELDFVPVLLPGREQRISEAAHDRLEPLVDALVRDLAPHCRGGFVLFGHSLGARIAYEVGLRLQDGAVSGKLRGFIAAGCPAPDIPTGMRVSHMEKASLKEQLRKLGGTVEGLLEDPHGLDIHEAAVRADFAVGESYCRSDGRKLTSPIVTIAGAEDHHVGRGAVRGWSRFSTASVRHETVPAGHFFIRGPDGAAARKVCGRLFGEWVAGSGGKSALGAIAVETAKWLPYSDPGEQADIRLFCLAFAGGNAGYFKDWKRLLLAGVQLCPIELPGHGTRFSEAPVSNMADLMPRLVHAVEPYLDRPYALFGHSLGALMAYEASRGIFAEYGAAPDYLIVSGRRAPQRPVRLPYRHRMGDGELAAELEGLGGMAPEILGDGDLMQLILPLLRADFQLTECYPHDQALAVDWPVMAFTGRADPEVPEEEMALWRGVASGRFDLEVMDGDHFYLNENRNRRSLVERISMLLSNVSVPCDQDRAVG